MVLVLVLVLFLVRYTGIGVNACLNACLTVLLSCFKTLLTPLTEEERRCHRLAVAANFKAFNLSLVHAMNDLKGEVSNVPSGTTTASQAVLNALCLKPNAPDAGFIFMCDPLGTGATPEPSHA